MVGLSVGHTNEGMTIDVVYRIVRSLLAAWWWLPSSGLVLASVHLSALDSDVTWTNTQFRWIVIGTTLWIITGSALSLSAWLDDWSRNGWTVKARGQQTNWNNELAVITGAMGGLGRELMDRLLEKGIRVAAIDVTEPATPMPDNAHFFPADVSNRTEVMAEAKNIINELGHPTILINNAGVVRARSVLDSDEKDVDLTFGVNVKAHFWTVQAFLPEMIKRNHGHVITVASSTAYIQAPNGVAYASSKAAALSFHEGLALELTHTYKAPGVRTSVICPGHMRTSMFRGFDAHLPNWLAPSLTTDTVAKLIEQIVLSGKSQHVIEPFYARTTTLMRAVPSWMSDGVLWFTRNAMEGVRTNQERARKDS